MRSKEINGTRSRNGTKNTKEKEVANEYRAMKKIASAMKNILEIAVSFIAARRNTASWQ